MKKHGWVGGWLGVAFFLMVTGTWTEVVVTNLVVAQRPGTKLVDITYDIVSDLTDAVPISIGIELGGTPVPSDTVWGYVGASVLPGIKKSVVWDAGAEWNDGEGELRFP